MKALMITAPASGSGKTTLTMGILRAMKNMGLNVCAFKTGPDYIDGAFLGKACKGRAGNLDMHLQGRNGLQTALSMIAADYCIIEGAMGYFDGIYNTCLNSSYDISKELGVNSILIYTPKGEMFSAVPKIKGMADFGDSGIKGVIFNGVSGRYYKMLREAVEKHTELKVLGFLPQMKGAELKSRHLGLVQSIELPDIDFRIEEIAALARDNIDFDGIMELMRTVKAVKGPAMKKYALRAAVARDKAFSFYYDENLSLLEEACRVTYFSPLEDGRLPECDLLYLGGGYPEVFKKELAENKTMLNSIREYSRQGGYIYAECGGFMYLTDSIDGEAMAGVFPGESRMTESLQNFGYVDIELKDDCMLGKRGDKIAAHEFHRSAAEIRGDSIFRISKTMEDKCWEGGYIYKNTYGGYPHISFIGSRHVLENILNSIERSRR